MSINKKLTEVGKAVVSGKTTDVALNIIDKVHRSADDISDVLVLSASRVAKNLRKSEVEDRPMSTAELNEIKALAPYFSKLMDKVLPDLVQAVGGNNTNTVINISTHVEKLNNSYNKQVNVTVDGIKIKQEEVDKLSEEAKAEELERDNEILNLIKNNDKKEEIQGLMNEQRENVIKKKQVSVSMLNSGMIKAGTDVTAVYNPIEKAAEIDAKISSFFEGLL